MAQNKQAITKLKKTNFMIFTNKKKIKPDALKISIDNEKIT